MRVCRVTDCLYMSMTLPRMLGDLSMVAVKFLDRQRKVLREELYSSEEKMQYFLNLVETDINFRKMLPEGTEYVMVDTDVFWLDKHDNKLKVRAWL